MFFFNYLYIKHYLKSNHDCNIKKLLLIATATLRGLKHGLKLGLIHVDIFLTDYILSLFKEGWIFPMKQVTRYHLNTSCWNWIRTNEMHLILSVSIFAFKCSSITNIPKERYDCNTLIFNSLDPWIPYMHS